MDQEGINVSDALHRLLRSRMMEKSPNYHTISAKDLEYQKLRQLIDERDGLRRLLGIAILFIICLVACNLYLYSGYEFRLRQASTLLGDKDWRIRERLHEGLSYTPEQIHLSLGANHTEIWVTWSTMKPPNEMSRLVYCDLTTDPHCDEEKISHGRLFERQVVEEDEKWIHATRLSRRILYTYRAKFQKLIPGNLYIYRVETRHDSQILSSRTYQYRAKNFDNYKATFKLALYGDLGLVNGQSIPRLIQDVDNSLYDLIVHNGDFAYDLNTHLGHYGDEFMRKIEPIAARVPYQTSVGNHEVAENFTHYDQRFTMINSGGLDVGKQNNFYYSFNVGPIHFVAFSTEFYYFLDTVGMIALENQYEWLKKDLSIATSPSERAKRPWIIVFGHRPMYCSSRDNDDCSKESNIIRKGLPFLGSYGLEKLFYDFGVDVEFYSHEHQYERFLPLYDGKVYPGTDEKDNPYHNPLAPVHIISGSAGCQERLDPFMNNTAPGSVKQISDYGYTRLTVSRCELRFEQVSDDQAGSVVDSFILTKTKQNFPAQGTEEFDCSIDRDDCYDSSNKICEFEGFLSPFE